MKNKGKLAEIMLMWMIFFVALYIQASKDRLMVGLLLPFILAVQTTYTNITPSKYESSQKRRNRSEKILSKTFGRWTRFASEGIISLLVCAMILPNFAPSITTSRLSLMAMAIFIVWIIYLAILIRLGGDDSDVDK